MLLVRLSERVSHILTRFTIVVVSKTAEITGPSVIVRELKFIRLYSFIREKFSRVTFHVSLFLREFDMH